jgi:hypothetical protein
MDLGLKVIAGVPDQGRTLLVQPGRRFRLGRHTAATGIDLTLHSIAINRHHCEVWRDEVGVWVKDLQSRGGTRVNEAVIPTNQPHRLLPCDWLQMGPARLRLVFLGPIEHGWLAWGGGAVRGLARGIREGGWQGQGPVLHDALLDAGCRDADLLEHCREGCPHSTDCSLLDLLLAVEAGPDQSR